jgi:hypothetical protein
VSASAFAITDSGDVVPGDDADAIQYFFPVEVEVRAIEPTPDPTDARSEAIDRIASGLADG